MWCAPPDALALKFLALDADPVPLHVGQRPHQRTFDLVVQAAEPLLIKQR